MSSLLVREGVGTMRNRRGTMGYIPPESVSAPEPCGVDQDTYAFGVLLMHIMAKPECLNPMIFMSKVSLLARCNNDVYRVENNEHFFNLCCKRDK